MKFFFLILFSSSPAFGAACCGGGFASPSLIAGDDAGQLTASYSYTSITDDVTPDSLWHRRASRESTVTYRLEGAHIFADRWQVGASLPFVSRARGGDSRFGLGDSSATLGYEALPDWDYSAWRPKGIAFLQLTVPTGRSANESTALYQLDSRGRGFWALGVGSLFTKAIGAWDTFVSLEGHRSFAKDFSLGRLHPGFGGTAGAGGGFNFSSLRLGAGLAWTYEDPVDVSGSASTSGASSQGSSS